LRREKSFQSEYRDYKMGTTSGSKLKKVAASSRDSIPVRRGKNDGSKGQHHQQHVKGSQAPMWGCCGTQHRSLLSKDSKGSQQ
jgi:hypothetical protein